MLAHAQWHPQGQRALTVNRLSFERDPAGRSNGLNMPCLSAPPKQALHLSKIRFAQVELRIAHRSRSGPKCREVPARE